MDVNRQASHPLKWVVVYPKIWKKVQGVRGSGVQSSKVQRLGNRGHMSGVENSRNGCDVIFESGSKPLNAEPLNLEP
jgi:hypothetical protein